MRISPNRQFDRLARRVLCVAAAAGVLYGVANLALDSAELPRWTSALAAAQAPSKALAPAVLSIPDIPGIPAVPRCTHCGWIESKREVPPGLADPRALAVFEYTARMADGTSNVFLETLPVRWRLGERLMFIAGDGAAR